MGKKIQCIGRYTMDAVTLGKGNFAHVELATHGVTNIKSIVTVNQQAEKGLQVAIKIIDTRKVKDEYVRANLYREARIMTPIRHPNIIRLYETLRASSLYCLVTEYAGGGELLGYIKSQSGCKLGELPSRSFMRQLLSAIHYLHERGIVHRDLKMENIMLDEKCKHIKLIDFGLSNIHKADEPLKTHCGSPEYAAPELFIVGKTYGPEIDIWSMGIIMYAIILGRLPFCTPFKDDYHRQRMLQQIQKGLSPFHDREMQLLSADCRNLIHQLIEPNPELRIPLREIEAHPWISKSGRAPFVPYVAPPKHKHLREEIVNELATLMDMKKSVVNESVKDYKADDLSAMYNMMMDKRKKELGIYEVNHGLKLAAQQAGVQSSKQREVPRNPSSNPPRSVPAATSKKPAAKKPANNAKAKAMKKPDVAMGVPHPSCLLIVPVDVEPTVTEYSVMNTSATELVHSVSSDNALHDDVMRSSLISPLREAGASSMSVEAEQNLLISLIAEHSTSSVHLTPSQAPLCASPQDLAASPLPNGLIRPPNNLKSPRLNMTLNLSLVNPRSWASQKTDVATQLPSAENKISNIESSALVNESSSRLPSEKSVMSTTYSRDDALDGEASQSTITQSATKALRPSSLPYSRRTLLSRPTRVSQEAAKNKNKNDARTLSPPSAQSNSFLAPKATPEDSAIDSLHTSSGDQSSAARGPQEPWSQLSELYSSDSRQDELCREEAQIIASLSSRHLPHSSRRPCSFAAGFTKQSEDNSSFITNSYPRERLKVIQGPIDTPSQISLSESVKPTQTRIVVTESASSSGLNTVRRSNTSSFSEGRRVQVQVPLKASSAIGLSPSSPSYDKHHARFSHIGSHALDVFYSPEDSIQDDDSLWRPVARHPCTPNYISKSSSRALKNSNSTLSAHSSVESECIRAPLVSNLDDFDAEDAESLDYSDIREMPMRNSFSHDLKAAQLFCKAQDSSYLTYSHCSNRSEFCNCTDGSSKDRNLAEGKFWKHLNPLRNSKHQPKHKDKLQVFPDNLRLLDCAKNSSTETLTSYRINQVRDSNRVDNTDVVKPVCSNSTSKRPLFGFLQKDARATANLSKSADDKELNSLDQIKSRSGKAKASWKQGLKRLLTSSGRTSNNIMPKVKGVSEDKLLGGGLTNIGYHVEQENNCQYILNKLENLKSENTLTDIINDISIANLTEAKNRMSQSFSADETFKSPDVVPISSHDDIKSRQQLHRL